MDRYTYLIKCETFTTFSAATVDRMNPINLHCRPCVLILLCTENQDSATNSRESSTELEDITGEKTGFLQHTEPPASEDQCRVEIHPEKQASLLDRCNMVNVLLLTKCSVIVKATGTGRGEAFRGLRARLVYIKRVI